MRAAPLALALVALAVPLAACGGGDGTVATTATAGPVEAPPMMAMNPPLAVGGVALPDVAPGAPATPFSMRARPGSLLLVFFGYTSCPDVCPTTLGALRSALALLPDGRVDVAMVSVDLRRDTPEVMRGYLGHFFTRYHALVAGDEDALLAAEKPFGAGHELVGDASTASYTVDHTAGVYVVDPQGMVRGVLAYGATPEAIAADLGGLLDA